ncbi:hypothetical protein K491DRAFT_762448 [Lophiostoma macrostomum CBS 122681]|uniref:J domain-containing protein n=1 Tax=Lophiostoma macrostomum CBS 122681 TaxID=1314788 RepID=A0A6A6SSK0_9PLEO|nr:hypothetical protein K491DRAFT_762448 [Lophiostoma macrostomum CBS 122681]
MAPFKSRFETPWQCLGVNKRSNESEIKVAYRALALASHPDKAPEAERGLATATFIELQAAYEVCLLRLDKTYAEQHVLESQWQLDPDLVEEYEVIHGFNKYDNDENRWKKTNLTSSVSILSWAKVKVRIPRNKRKRQIEEEKRLERLRYEEAIRFWEAHKLDVETRLSTATEGQAEEDILRRSDRERHWAEHVKQRAEDFTQYKHISGFDNTFDPADVVSDLNGDADEQADIAKIIFDDNEKDAWLEDKLSRHGRAEGANRQVYEQESGEANYMRNLRRIETTNKRNNQNDYLDGRDVVLELKDSVEERFVVRGGLSRIGYVRHLRLMNNSLRQIEATNKRNSQKDYLDKWDPTLGQRANS